MRANAAKLFLRLFAVLLLVAGPASAFDTRATSAYVYDVTTGTVLFEKQADIALPPASMSKLMTLNMLFEALKDGRTTLETRFGVSSRAKNMGGSTMFLNTNDRPTVEELIQGIIVMSGNDACVVVAEGLGGTEDAFAVMMTERAAALGMVNSSFGNASGWPHAKQRMSMKDLALLASRLIEEFPEYYPYFAQSEFAFDGRAPENRFNRNPLLKLGIGADGLKTGHTSEAGYGLVGSAQQGNRRIVFVISGLQSESARAEEAEAIVNWAFLQFAMKNVVKAGDTVAEADVWLGAEDSVALTPGEDVTLLIPAMNRDGISAEITWNGPIEAPIAKGQELARMLIRRDGMSDTEVPLFAVNAVAEAGFLDRYKAAFAKVSTLVMGGDAPTPTTTTPPVTN